MQATGILTLDDVDRRNEVTIDEEITNSIEYMVVFIDFSNQ